MINQREFIKLRDILIELYPSESGAKRVVYDAEINSALIEFSSQATHNWQAILSEAQKSKKINALINIVLRDYPNNEELQKIFNAYYVEQKECGEEPNAVSGFVPIPDRSGTIQSIVATEESLVENSIQYSARSGGQQKIKASGKSTIRDASQIQE